MRWLGRGGRKDAEKTNVDVSIDYFPFVRLGDYDAIHCCGCVGHNGAWNCLMEVEAQRNEFKQRCLEVV
jgi:hypothetical protein